MITIEPGTTEAISYIVRHLRDMDYIEMSATTPDMNPGNIAGQIMIASHMVFVARNDDVPVSCWGLIPMWPGVGFAFCFGTDDWGSVLLPMTRHVRRFMLPLLLDTGFHRIETRSLAARQDVGRWLEIFGAEAEAVMRGSGARGEDFILYAWLRDEHQSKIQSAAGHHNTPSDDRRRRRIDGAGDDAAARVADLLAGVPMQSNGDYEISAYRHWKRVLSAHGGGA